MNEFIWNIETYDGRYIVGWIGCKSRPNDQIMIGIKDVTGFTDIFVVDGVRSDVEQIYGFRQSGFNYSIKNKHTAPISIYAKYVTNDIEWTLLEEDRIFIKNFGYIDSIVGVKVSGWALFTSENNQEINIEIKTNVITFCSFKTTIDRYDVYKKYGGTLKCGFEIEAPWSILLEADNACSLVATNKIGEFIILDPNLKLNSPQEFETNYVFDLNTMSWSVE